MRRKKSKTRAVLYTYMETEEVVAVFRRGSGVAVETLLGKKTGNRGVGFYENPREANKGVQRIERDLVRGGFMRFFKGRPNVG